MRLEEGVTWKVSGPEERDGGIWGNVDVISVRFGGTDGGVNKEKRDVTRGMKCRYLVT